MKFLLVTIMICSVGFAQNSFADQAGPQLSSHDEAKQLALDVVVGSKLEELMKVSQPNDLANLKSILAAGILEDAQLKADLEDLRDNVLPQIANIADQNIRDGEYLKIQMIITMLASERGYYEVDK